MWGGRFAGHTSTLTEDFTASVSFDRRLYSEDIDASIVHARMLAATGVLTKSESERITAGLEQIRGRVESGDFQWRDDLEDVHMNIEAALTDLIGDDGKKLHTARSRNDQVATDMRLHVRRAIDEILPLQMRLMEALIQRAEAEAGTVMPGLTHMQAAQPVTFGHHLLAWFEMLMRDYGRFADCRRRLNVCPLGVAALAGTSFPVDRRYSAEQLGFAEIAENSLDAVSDRDFCMEFAAAAAMLMTHLSRFSEEMIYWMSPVCRYVELPDIYCTGSSIMPQKKNPDLPELVRGKTGRVYGNLMSLLTLMKAQPLAYNRDNQEDKEPLFDSIDTVRACLRVYIEIVPAMKIDRDQMRQAANQGFPTATDLADYLVRKGVPFRQAHAVTGSIVRAAMEKNVDLCDMPVSELQTFCDRIEDDVRGCLTVDQSVSARCHVGGTAPDQVRQAAKRAAERLRQCGCDGL